jgi:hypothetical protein
MEDKYMTMRLFFSTAAIVVMVFLSFLPCCGEETAPSLAAKSVLGGKVEILIPSTFTVMKEDMLKLKYPTQNRPALVYTNDAGTINIAFTHTPSSATQNDIPEMKSTFKKMFNTLYKSATWYSDGVITVNGRKVGYLEFLTPAIDTNIYNLMFFTDCQGRVLLCSFNCMENQMKSWAPVGKRIMNSLKTK